MTQLVSRQIALAKVEATYGTDSTPVASANAFLVSNLQIDETIKMNQRNVIKETLAPLQAVTGPYMAKINFDVELRGSGVAGTAPEFDALFLACGLSKTVSADTNVAYTPNSSARTSATIYVYQDGSLFKCTGAVGTYSIDVKSGGIPTIKFQFDAHIESHTDTVLPTGAVYSTVVPPAAIDCDVAIGAYNPVLDSFAFSSGCKVENPESIGATDGYAQFLISTRAAKGSLSVEATTVSGFDFYGSFSAGTTASFSLPVGVTAGNIITITHPVFYIEDVKQSNKNGILGYTISYGAVESGAGTDDEVKIVFT